MSSVQFQGLMVIKGVGGGCSHPVELSALLRLMPERKVKAPLVP